jgi:hypothetical protein
VQFKVDNILKFHNVVKLVHISTIWLSMEYILNLKQCVTNIVI